jgi:hypothetical protein
MNLNLLFFSWLSGLNIVIGAAMLCLLISGPTKSWSSFTKFGFFTMACGLLGQAICVFTGTTLEDPLWDQLWVFKDIGLAVFTIALVNQWIDQLRS